MWRIGRPSTHYGGQPEDSGRVISPAPMMTHRHCVSQWPWTGIMLERGVIMESDVGPTGPVPGGWLSNALGPVEPATRLGDVRA